MAHAHGRAGRSLLSKVFSGLFSMGGDSCVGLSVGASSIKIAELSRKKNLWTLKSAAIAPLPEGAIDNREIMQPDQVIQSLDSAWKTSQIRNRNVCLGLTGNGLIIKHLSLNLTDARDLEDQVYWEAEQYIPYDLSEVVIDYQVIGKSKGGNTELILVAVKNSILDQYRKLLEEVRLTPSVIDAEAFALQYVYEANYPNLTQEAVLIADIGSQNTKMIVTAREKPLLIKDAAFGGSVLTLEISRALGLGFQDAEGLKVSEQLPKEVIEVFNRTIPVLVQEIRKTIEYYSASSIGPSVAAVMISGGASRTPGLSATLESQLKLPCQYLNPFQTVQVDPAVLSRFDVNRTAPQWVVPVGLAMRAGGGLT